MSAVAPIKVFVLDDHELVRRGMAEMIGAHDDLVVVGEAATADEAVRGIRATEPDVAVLDLRLRHGCGLDVCRQITCEMPSVASLIFTAVTDERAMVEAAAAGARAFTTKSIRSNELVDHIRALASGTDLLDGQRLDAAAAMVWNRSERQVERLSEQERRIVELIGCGWSNREIGRELILAEKTVKNYVSRILAKLAMSSRTEIAVLAARQDERENRWCELTNRTGVSASSAV